MNLFHVDIFDEGWLKSMTHATIKLIWLSMVQTSSLMTSHDVGITAVSARIFAFRSLNFSVQAIFSESQRECDGILCDFTWFVELEMTWCDLYDVTWCQLKLECLSRSKNRSVIGSLTVTQTPSIRIKTSLIESKHQRSSQNPLIGWNFDQWELGSSETLFTGSKIDEPRLFMWLSSWPNLTFYGVYRVYMRIVVCLVH